MCLSADWAGILILFNSSSFLDLVAFSLISLLVDLLSLVFHSLPVLFWVVCLGRCLSASHLLLPALVVLVSGVLLPLCFPCGSLGCCGVLFSCCCCSVFPAWLLCSFLLLVSGLLRFGRSLLACSLPSHPVVGPLAPSGPVSVC